MSGVKIVKATWVFGSRYIDLLQKLFYIYCPRKDWFLKWTFKRHTYIVKKNVPVYSSSFTKKIYLEFRIALFYHIYERVRF